MKKCGLQQFVRMDVFLIGIPHYCHQISLTFLPSISLHLVQELSHLKKELMQSHHMSSLLDSSSKELENIVDQMKRELKDRDEVRKENNESCRWNWVRMKGLFLRSLNQSRNSWRLAKRRRYLLTNWSKIIALSIVCLAHLSFLPNSIALFPSPLSFSAFLSHAQHRLESALEQKTRQVAKLDAAYRQTSQELQKVFWQHKFCTSASFCCVYHSLQKILSEFFGVKILRLIYFQKNSTDPKIFYCEIILASHHVNCIMHVLFNNILIATYLAKLYYV